VIGFVLALRLREVPLRRRVQAQAKPADVVPEQVAEVTEPG